jgi:hypothetical protein
MKNATVSPSKSTQRKRKRTHILDSEDENEGETGVAEPDAENAIAGLKGHCYLFCISVFFIVLTLILMLSTIKIRSCR